MRREVKIFTDGASSGNPGPGGWGAVIASQTHVKELGGGEKNTTNNKMELQAVVSALQSLESNDNQQVIIYSDSAYVVNGATSWIHGWKKNNWQTKEKKDVANKDIWEHLDTTMKRHHCTWIRLEGHVGIPGNERADIIATSFAQGKSITLYNGSVEEYTVDLSQVDLEQPLKQQKDRSKMKAYSYLSLVGGVFARHEKWADCAERVKGQKNARFRKSISLEDEEKIKKEWKV